MGSRGELLRCWLRHLLEEFRRALLHLCLSEIFLARDDPPGIACRISDGARSVAPELIGHWHLHLRARAYCSIEDCIAVLHVQPQRRGGSAEAQWDQEQAGASLSVRVRGHRRLGFRAIEGRFGLSGRAYEGFINMLRVKRKALTGAMTDGLQSRPAEAKRRLVRPARLRSVDQHELRRARASLPAVART